MVPADGLHRLWSGAQLHVVALFPDEVGATGQGRSESDALPSDVESELGVMSGPITPLHGFRSFVVLANVPHQFSLRIGDGGEDAACGASRSILANHSSTWLSQDE